MSGTGGIRPPAQTVSTGLVVAVVGFFSSFPIVLQGLAGVGANAEESGSGILVIGLSAAVWGLAAGGLVQCASRRGWA